MAVKKKKKELSDVGRMLENHRSGCRFFVYSGNRLCTCGRDNAILTMKGVEIILGKEKFKQLFGEVFQDEPLAKT